MKILIADDHWVVRESLKLVMGRIHRRFVSLEAGTFQEAKNILRQHPDVDLMLVDLIMPGFDQFAGLQELRQEFPDIPVVVVSVHDDAEYIVRSISYGVVGYIPKTAGGEDIERALERVLAGEVSFPRTILQKAGPTDRRTAPRATPAAPSAEADTLTHREKEVLGFLGNGLSVARIAGELSLSPHTVRVHIGNMAKKLGLKDRAALIHYAVSQAHAGT